MEGKIEFINPEKLHSNPAFTQVVTTQGPGKTIYVGGQNAVSTTGKIQGIGDLAGQTTQAMENVRTALEAVGATFENVIKLSIYIKHGQNLIDGFDASRPFLADLKNPPAITGLFVAELAHPDYLVEIEAIAFLAKTDK